MDGVVIFTLKDAYLKGTLISTTIEENVMDFSEDAKAHNYYGRYENLLISKKNCK
jgi:hypothetical protein